jgi:photoactive yellow protein
MTAVNVDFNALDLAAHIETLSQHALDNLPFGVVRLDREGTILFYSATEERLSGYGMDPLGRNFFSYGECVGVADLRRRIMEAMENGRVDLEFGWSTEKTDVQRDLRIRVQSARSGGVWLFFDRD